ncbi:hypothetical protein [Caulobacter sp. 17J80-11]|uniref:hypothetical protein n=1 Tax=Caulobacter sp. 17J80-11 TaxID=2763502 RepID=UPI001653CF75|nr:hypothetical protein [Caulobacter sp. 17J80-11]MBC6983591.1 hypothetical protein [Caulobacter sp. 17J80-11]
MSFDLDRTIAAALTAKGSGRLSFVRMLQLLETGRERDLPLSAIDATGEAGRIPRTECGFYVDLNELEDAGEDRATMAQKSNGWALDHYRSGKVDVGGAEFEVWFRP